MKKFVISMITLCFGLNLQAQMIEDALNMSISNTYITPRAGGLGIAYYGISDDFASIAYNPAGLALIGKGEISFGFNINPNSTETEFLANNMNTFSTNIYLTNLGIILPFKTNLGNATLGIGYYMESNFNNTMEFGALNPYSTYIQYTAEESRKRGWGIAENFATYLWLADDNYDTPIKKGLFQEAMINEKGGIKDFSGAIALELSENLTVGFTLTGKWGNYNYLREYIETDINNIYNEFIYRNENGKLVFDNVDFHHLKVDESVDQDISGVTASLGLMGKIENFVRIGFTLKFPSYYEVNENFSQTAIAYFDNGDIRDTMYLFSNYYKIITPWIFSGGISFNIEGLIATAGIEYTDLTQMEFSGESNLELLNLDIKKQMTALIKYGAGLEWQTPFLPVDLRVGFSYTTPPYSSSFKGEERIGLSFGTGIYLQNNMRLDLVAEYQQYKKLWNIYGNSSETKLYFTQKPINIGIQLIYRY